MTNEERETVIQFDDSGTTASVYTCHKWLYNSLIRRKLKPSDVYRQDGREIAWEFIVPQDWISVRPKRRVSPKNLASLHAAKRAQLASKSTVVPLSDDAK